MTTSDVTPSEGDENFNYHSEDETRQKGAVTPVTTSHCTCPALCLENKCPDVAATAAADSLNETTELVPSSQNQKAGGLPARTSTSFLSDLVQGEGQEGSRTGTPGWVQSFLDFVDKVSASPSRVMSIICLIYGVIFLLCFVILTLWTSMAAGNVLALGLLAILSAILMGLVGIVCFLPQVQ
jgi:hypothetical protein